MGAEALHRLSFEMLSILESVAKHGNVMDYEISQGLASRIRRVLKEAHGG